MLKISAILRCFAISCTIRSSTMITTFYPILRGVAANVRIIPACSMYSHPYTEYFKKKRDSVSPGFYKQTTGLTGLFVDENPHFNLKLVYRKLLRILGKMPEDCAYRKSTEEIVKHRLAIVESEPDIAKLEEKIGMGQIEEVHQQAEYELQAAREIFSSKAWEPLLDTPPESQWRWPIH